MTRPELNYPDAQDYIAVKPAGLRQAVPEAPTAVSAPDLVCLSHLRWDFVFQRPQHLLTRCAAGRRVFFIEEAMPAEDGPRLEVRQASDNIWVVVPRLRPDADSTVERRRLLDELFAEQGIDQYILWYYTPAAVPFTRHLKPLVTVYDCMDELALFKYADGKLPQLEAELFDRADLVFTGGASLYEAKRGRHPSVHLFPSSIDMAHFCGARTTHHDPADQAGIPHPRLGFFGVIDERMDLQLVAGLAAARPDWHLVMIGPVVKISRANLPVGPNIHYLGGKRYAELPAYLSGWDVALLPFARNESTRFISPTKTPEYLAGGCPVVSTPIRDVVRPYGDQGLVSIASTTAEFVAAVEHVLAGSAAGQAAWLERVDAFLGEGSWDKTWQEMWGLIAGKMRQNLTERGE